MVERGHQVTVLAPFPNRPQNEVYPGYRRRWRWQEQREHYPVVHTWHTISKQSTIPSRGAQNISFGVTTSLEIAFHQRPDAVFVYNWPLFAQAMNVSVLSLLRVPILLWVRDIYPESLLKSRSGWWWKPVSWLSLLLDRFVYSQCRTIALPSQDAANHIETSRGVPSSKLRVVPDWIDTTPFEAPLYDFRARQNLSRETFVAAYVGGLTRTAGLELYLEVAERLRYEPEFELLLVGDGSYRQSLQEQIQIRRLTNIRLIRPLEMKDVPSVQAAADVLMLSLSVGEADLAVPSKLLFYLFSGRPVLASLNPDGAAGRLVVEAQAGHVLPQGDPDAVADALRHLATDTTLRQHMGKSARSYARKHFTAESRVPEICEALESMVR